MNLYVLVLRVIHISGAVFWAGTSWALAGFFSPAARDVGPAGNQVMGQVMGRRRLTDVFGLAAVATVLPGILLYWRLSGGLNPAWITSGSGLALTGGALSGLAAFLVGFSVARPVSVNLAKLGAQAAADEGPPDPEIVKKIQHLQSRLEAAGVWTSVLLAISVLLMASAEQIF
jgi:hypothetical protein